MRWFKRGPSTHQTGLAMVGAKAGDRVIFVGAGALDLAAHVGLATGLNGRTLVVARGDGVRERLERAAADAGALVEYEDAPAAMLPLDADSFDIAVITVAPGLNGGELRDAAREAFRVVRAGGRIIVRTAARRGGVFSTAQEDVDALDALLRAGTVAGRLLATTDGVSYFEARRSR